jgi:hypothetical protein
VGGRRPGALSVRKAAWMTVALAMEVVACGASTPATERPSPSPTPTPSAVVEPSLPVPADFTEACRLESQVCPGRVATPWPFPAALQRPLQLPKVPPGVPCPASEGQPLTTPAFGGVALGTGPARPLIAPGPGDQDPRHGIKVGSAPDRGWYSFKTLWFTEPSYQGPVRIRGARVDGQGQVAFGERADAGELVIPPGPTVNSGAGYREAPGGTWIREPGCYAWQVDGVGFSTVIVFSAVLG